MSTELGKLFKLAWPIMAGGAVNSIMPFMNTVFLGHLGELALASGGLALSIFVFIMVLFWGLFATMTPLIARYRGAGEDGHISTLVRSAFILMLFCSAFIISLYHFVPIILTWMNYPAAVIEIVRQFFNTMSFATPADLTLGILYALCFGLSKPRYVLLVTLVQVPVNLFVNYAFMFGAFHFPAFGVAGIGVGVACTYWVMVVIFLLVLSKVQLFSDYLWRAHFSVVALKELVMIGGPAGGHWLIQMGFFSFVALMMGKISLIALAAYQVTLQVYSVFFNVVYNFNHAVSIRVADGLGQKLTGQVRYNYRASYYFVALIIVIMVSILIFADAPLVHLFTQKDAVASPLFLEYCKQFLWLMPIFAVFDLLDYGHFQVLRAYKDTRFPMFAVFVVYWLIVAPLIYVAIHEGILKNPLAIWYAMIVASVMTLSIQRLRYQFQYNKFFFAKPATNISI